MKPKTGANAVAWMLLVATVVVVSPACTPRLARRNGFDLNPIEILERSPRIYRIGFEAIADSMETARARTYFMRSMQIDMEAAGPDSSPAESRSPRALARMEYYKAKRRIEGGATGAAVRHVRRALQHDPGFLPANLLLGEILLSEYRVNEASDLFGRILSVDGANSDALVGLARCFMLTGKAELARRALIDAIIFDRVNLEAWRSLHLLGAVQRFTVTAHDAPELGVVRKARGRHYDIVVDTSVEKCPIEATAWIVYASQRAVWRFEGKYKQYLGATPYSPTYEEDVDCYMALAAAWNVLTQQDSTTCDSEYLNHLSRVADEGYLVPHVLFDHVLLDDPFAARGFSGEALDGLRAYIDRYVLVSKG